MTLPWWHLPGARRFFDRAADDVRAGKNLIFRLPEHHADGFDRALVEAVGAGTDNWEFFSLAEGAATTPPLDFLYSRFLPDSPASTIRTLEALINAESFAGKIIWLGDAGDSDNWKEWRKFLTVYENACRNVALFARTIFVVPLAGALCNQSPDEDICLSAREWRGALDETDALLFAASLSRRGNSSRVRRRLSIALAANLAGWDLPFAEQLADEPFENLLEPAAMLDDFARARGWHADTPQNWEAGTLDEMDEVPQPHSAIFAIAGKSQLLTKRLWSAQAAVLLPFIEECRQELLLEFAAELPALLMLHPVETRFGATINDVHELEIGHLETLLGKKVLAPETRRRLSDLRRVRNDLSHLRLASPHLLLNF